MNCRTTGVDIAVAAESQAEGNITLPAMVTKLLDFGPAKLRPTPDTSRLTEAPTTAANLTEHGAVLGTF